MLAALLLFILPAAVRSEDETEKPANLLSGWEYTWSELKLENQVPDPQADISDQPVRWSPWNPKQVESERQHRTIIWLRRKLPDFRLRDPAIFFDSIDLNFRLYAEDGLLRAYGTTRSDGKIDFRGWPWHLIQLRGNDAGRHLYLRVESDYRDIGIWHRVLLGERAAILTGIGVSSLDRILLGMIFASAGLMSLLLFALQRQWREALYFGCISILSAVTFMSDPGNFVRLLLWERADMWMRLEYTSGFLATGFYGLFFGIIFPLRTYRLFFHGTSIVFFGISAIAAALSFVDLRWLIQANSLINIPVLIAVGIFSVILVRERHQPGVVYLLIGFGIQSATAVIDIAKTLGLVQLEFPVVKYGYTGFLLFLVFLVSSRLIRINQLLKDYSHSLEQRETELKQSNVRLEEINRLKNDFLSRLSLEFRLPVAAIVNLTASLVQRPGFNETDRRYIEFIHRASDRLEKLVESIRTLSRLQNSDVDLNRQPVDSGAVLRHAARVFLSTAPDNPIQIDGCRGLPPAYADPLRLQQIFFDILAYLGSWQAKANLTVSVREDYSSADGSRLVFRFEKKAELPDDRKTLAFEPFLSIPDPSLAVPVPTLSAARQLVHLHGGRLSLFAEGAGTTICELELPARDGSSQSALPEEIQRRADLEVELNTLLGSVPARATESTLLLRGGPTDAEHSVLVIESDPAQLFALFTRLEEEGYSVTGVASGSMGLDQIRRHPFDIVLVGSYLSDMAGLEFCESVREAHSLLDLPVIVLAESSDTSVSGSQQVFNDHLLRPVQPQEMIARVGLHLSLSRAMREHLRFLEIQRDLGLVREIQEHLLPEEKPRSDAFELSTIYVPAESVSGDLYDFHFIDDQRLCLFLADVTGHGLAAAMLASMVKVAFVANHALLDRPDQALHSMNHLMLKLFSNQLFTACLLILDFSTGTFRYARAGHPPLYLLRRKTGEIEEMLPRGRLMGIEENLQTEVREGSFAPGDRFFLYTDGVTEVRNARGNYFDYPGFLKRNQDRAIDRLSEELLKQLMGWNESRPGARPSDDITSLMIEIKKGR